MPVHLQSHIRNLSKTEFDERDAMVMRCAYASQNGLGRLCDERVYESDLAARLRAEGLKEVYTQVPVTVVAGSFEKTYWLDLVVDSAIYELKVVSAFTGEHDTQALNYAMLCDVSHAKLLNLRTPRVQGRLKFTPLTLVKRRAILCHDDEWRRMSPRCEMLKEGMVEVLRDLGSFLDARLYEEAVIHLLGGAENCVIRTPVVRDGIQLGVHRFQTHAPGIGFMVTSLAGDTQQYRENICSLLQMTSLQGIQWINLRHATVQFITTVNRSIRLTPFV